MNVNVKATDAATASAHRLGSKSDFWKKVQIALIRRYYLESGDDTGVYDRKTQTAVYRYQTDRSEGQFWAFHMPLVVDGKVGSETLGRLLPPAVMLGSKGPHVRLLQDILIADGYSPGIPDGDFGPNTEAAVKDFQRDNYDYDGNPLDPDGVIGTRMWVALWS